MPVWPYVDGCSDLKYYILLRFNDCMLCRTEHIGFSGFRCAASLSSTWGGSFLLFFFFCFCLSVVFVSFFFCCLFLPKLWLLIWMTRRTHCLPDGTIINQMLKLLNTLWIEYRSVATPNKRNTLKKNALTRSCCMLLPASLQWRNMVQWNLRAMVTCAHALLLCPYSPVASVSLVREGFSAATRAFDGQRTFCHDCSCDVHACVMHTQHKLALTICHALALQ